MNTNILLFRELIVRFNNQKDGFTFAKKWVFWCGCLRGNR